MSKKPLAMVTGGSAGIGYCIARELLERGYDVAINGSSDKVHTAAKELSQYGTVHPFQSDAATYEGVESFWNFVHNLGQPLEIAVLNVGIVVGGLFVDNSLEDEMRLLAINVTGTVHTAKRVVQDMVPRGRGKILIVSSMSATTPTPYETTYGPSKAFGFSFAETLRHELRETGVTVTALLPGKTNTEFHQKAGLDKSALGKIAGADPAMVARIGLDALMADQDHVVGGNEMQVRELEENRSLSEPFKAARHAQFLRPLNS